MNHPQLAGDWWKDPRTCAVLSRYWQQYIVGLHVLSSQGGKLVSYVYTGFLLEVWAVHFWITAGHVVDELAKLAEDDRIILRGAEWADGYSNPDAASIPVDIKALKSCPMRDGHIDIGVVDLPENTVSLLKANPAIKFFTPLVWLRNESANPVGYYVVGIPNEHQHTTTTALSKRSFTTDVAFPIVALPIERIDPPAGKCGEELWQYPDAFYGRLLSISLPDIGPVQNIKGMSGGPIISIEMTPTSQMKYRVFAIQSEWLPNSRIVRCTPIEVLDAGLRVAFEPDMDSETAATPSSSQA